jgi:hypothetical protein
MQEKEELRCIDPDIQNLDRVYRDCFKAIFNCKPRDDARRYKKEILNLVSSSGYSLKMFILANMVAHKISQETVVECTEKAQSTVFTAKALSMPYAVKRCKAYAETCEKDYGIFNLSTLSSLANEDYASNDIESAMLHSEIVAGRFVTTYKIMHGGKPYDALYEHEELTLSPYWLAIEPTYKLHVLDRYWPNRCGTEKQNQHRFEVICIHKQLARHVKDQYRMFLIRQRIMSKALESVLMMQHHKPQDFLISNKPVTDAMTLWLSIGRIIQHYQCYLLYSDESSLFQNRRGKINIELDER